MSGKVVVVENASFKEMSSSRQYQLDAAVKLVAGSRKESVLSFESYVEELKSQAHVSSNVQSIGQVIVLPVLLPREEQWAPRLVKLLTEKMPFSNLFGMVFLLVGEEQFSPESLLDAYWVDVLDSLYDIAIPTSICVWHQCPPAVESFSLAANLSSLFREMDSLLELAELGKTVRHLEFQISTLAVSLQG